MASRVSIDSKKREFHEVLAKCNGVIKTACQKLKISRMTYYNWRKEDLDFAAKCDEIYEEKDDFVESQLFKKIEDGDTACIIFYAKTKMKHRGYVERIERTGKDGESLSLIQFSDKDEEIIERAIQRRMELKNAKQSEK